jgi:hypothetical protein
MDVGRAQEAAIRWAGITFHLSGPAAQDSTHLIHAVLWVPSADRAPSTQPGSQPRTGSATRAALEFLSTSTGGTTALQPPAAAPPARPSGRRSRTGGPGLRP